MIRHRPSIAALAALLWALPAFSAHTWPPHEPPHQEWHDLSLGGKKVGFLHVSVEREGDQEIALTLDTEMRVRRMGARVEMGTTARFVQTREGRPVAIDYEERVAATSTRTHGEVVGDSLVLTTLGLQASQRRALPVGADLVFPWTADRLLAAAFAAGESKLRYRSFVPEMGGIETFDVELLGVEQGDEDRRLLHTRTRMSSMPDAGTDEWRDIATGTVLRSRADLMGIVQETRLVDRAAAEAPPLDYTLDLLFETLVESGRRIPRPRAVDELLLRVSPRDAGTAYRGRLSWPPHQVAVEPPEVAASAGGDAPLATHPSLATPPMRLSIRRPPEPTPSYTRPYRGPDLAAELASSLLIQSGDPEIRRVVADQVGAESDPLAAARVLNQWVFRSIGKKSFEVGFASALEALRRREGDCTEHALLLVALCRAAAIPARAASGLVYFRGAFGYHMWTEVYVGVWFPLDPAFGLDSVDATHVKIASNTLAEGAIGSAFVPMLDVMGRIDLEVEEYVAGGIRFGGARPALRIEGAAVRSPEHRLRFRAPGGWRPSPAGELPPDYLQMFYPADPAKLAGLAVKALVVGYDFSLAGAEARIAAHVGRFTARRALRIGGVPALRLDFVDPDDGLRRLALVFLDGDTYFMFTMENPGPGDEPLFDAVVESIELGAAS